MCFSQPSCLPFFSVLSLSLLDSRPRISVPPIWHVSEGDEESTRGVEVTGVLRRWGRCSGDAILKQSKLKRACGTAAWSAFCFLAAYVLTFNSYTKMVFHLKQLIEFVIQKEGPAAEKTPTKGYICASLLITLPASPLPSSYILGITTSFKLAEDQHRQKDAEQRQGCTK